jgi:hypothetical protein
MGGYLTVADSPALTEMRARNDALFGTARTAGQLAVPTRRELPRRRYDSGPAPGGAVQVKASAPGSGSPATTACQLPSRQFSSAVGLEPLTESLMRLR